MRYVDMSDADKREAIAAVSVVVVDIVTPSCVGQSGLVRAGASTDE